MSEHRPRVILPAVCLACALCAPPSAASAQPDDARDDAILGGGEEDAVESREDAMFGGDGAGDDEEGGSRDDAFFGEGEGVEEVDIEGALEDAEADLTLGGFYFGQVAYNVPEGFAREDQSLSAPNLLDLFVDARPNDRVRVYARGRLVYRPTLAAAQADASAGQDAGAGGGIAATGLGGGDRLQAQLDQLWLKYDIGRVVYVTVGRQRVRWGASRFFNPTDFLNASQINPIALFDARLGVDMVKVHVPVGNVNVYGVGLFDGASSIEDVGGALRVEALIGSAEVTVSAIARRQSFDGPQPIPNPLAPNAPLWEPSEEWPRATTPLRLGADVSAPLGPIDAKLEVALTRGTAQPFYRGDLSLEFPDLEFPEDYRREDDLIVQAVASVEWIHRYNDEDLLVMGAEYFYNDAGYEDADLYLWTLLQGGFRPLYMGRHYVAGAVSLPGPGPLDDMSFTVSTIANLSDRSALSRFDYSLALLSDLNLSAYAQLHWGEPGELRFGVDVPGVPGVDGLEGGISLPPPRFVFGGAARVSF
jgi:hypothetical protein